MCVIHGKYMHRGVLVCIQYHILVPLTSHLQLSTMILKTHCWIISSQATTFLILISYQKSFGSCRVKKTKSAIREEKGKVISSFEDGFRKALSLKEGKCWALWEEPVWSHSQDQEWGAQNSDLMKSGTSGDPRSANLPSYVLCSPWLIHNWSVFSQLHDFSDASRRICRKAGRGHLPTQGFLWTTTPLQGISSQSASPASGSSPGTYLSNDWRYEGKNEFVLAGLTFPYTLSWINHLKQLIVMGSSIRRNVIWSCFYCLDMDLLLRPFWGVINCI